MLLIIIILMMTRSTPVIYSYIEPGDVVGEPIVSIFNPFRDRDPENCADVFLQSLKEGECIQLMNKLSMTDDQRRSICERENTNKILSWSLKNRISQDSKIVMYFRVWRQNDDLYNPLWVLAEKIGSEWIVTDYTYRY